MSQESRARVQVRFPSGSTTQLLTLDEALAELIAGRAEKVSFTHQGGRFIIRAGQNGDERANFQRLIGVWEYWADKPR